MKTAVQKRFFICFAMLMLVGRLDALYNGNPSFPMMPEEGIFIPKDSWVTVKAGYEWDDLFNRNLRLHEHRPHLKRKVKEYEAMTNFGVFTLGCNDRVEVYGSFGATDAEITQHPFSDVHLKYKTDNRFAWTVGGRAILAYWGDTQFGVDAKYYQFNPQISKLILNGQSINPDGANYHYREWQVGLAVSHRLKWFIPYIGLKYSDVRAKFHHLKAIETVFPKKHFTMKNKYPIGLFLGFGVSPTQAFNINAEVRVFDETAITLSGDIRF